jgi:hypothetical protein
LCVCRRQAGLILHGAIVAPTFAEHLAAAACIVLVRS